MRKKLKISLLFVCILNVNLIFTPFSYASSSSCQTCTSSPSQLTQYTSAMNSLASSIKSKTGKNISSKAVNSIYVYSKLLFGMPIQFLGEDLVADFKVIYNGYPAVRDRKKVSALDKTLGDAMRQLATNGGFDEVMSSSDVSKYSSQLKQLKLLSDVEIQDGTTYGELIGFLWQTQKIFKQTFLHASFTNVKKDYDLDEFVRGAYKDYTGRFSKNYDYPSLNSNYIKDLQEAYRCSLDSNSGEEGGGCPDKLDDFLEKIDDIVNIGDKISNTYQKLNKARTKLQNLLKGIGSRGFNGEYTERKKDIIKMQIGGDLKELLGDSKNSGLSSLGKIVQESAQLKDTLRGYSDDTAEYAREAEAQEGDDSKKNEELNLDTMKKKEEKENFSKMMKTTFTSILNVQSDFMTDIPSEAPEPSVTMDFPELSKKVYKAKKELKDATKTLGEACDNQCKNAEGDCYYKE